MAFNLKKVLKALLLSSSQPLAVKDIQAAFTRYHEGAAPAATPGAPEEASPATDGAEVFAEPPDDAELYTDVPSLVTLTQIREAMDAIGAELRAADDGLLLIEASAGYRVVTAPRFARWVRVLRQEPPPLKLSQSSLETLAVVAYRQPVTRTEIETIRGVSAEAGLNRLLERELIHIAGRAELPASDVLTSRQIDEWLRTAASPDAPGDREMGLSEEAAPDQAPAAPAPQP